MAMFLAVPLKRTGEVDLVKPLRGFIQNTFTTIEPDDYNQPLSEFNKLRNLMISKSVDKHDSALEVLYRYYDQLKAVESKLPITENQIRIQFKWRDAFDKESFFSGKRTLAIASGGYEKVCMLFNIAALQSQIAEVQNWDSDEGLKIAAKYFQQASGIFGHLKDIVLSHVQQDPTPDLGPDTLNALSSLMLAQGQEAIYRKAAADRMKDAMVAKIAFQCSELYADAMKLMQLQSLKELWPKEWIATAVMKQAAFHGMAEFYQGCAAQQKKSYGEQIARMQHAIELLASAQTRGGNTFCFKDEQGKVQRELQAVKKDNDFIYHDIVPDVRSLAPIGKAAIAKVIPVPDRPMSEKFTDLFEKIVPLPVHEALTAFESRKSQIVNMEIGRLREQTTLMNSILASLNLPAALEDLSGAKVPASVTEKAQQIQQLGGMQYIDKMMCDIPDLLARNREILDECLRMLDCEEQSDKQLREQFKERWSRTPSGTLTKPMRDESNKYKMILDTAINADRVVKEKYEKHKKAISILSKSPAELEECLPSASSGTSLQNLPVTSQMKKMMEEVETMKAERDVVETELNNAVFDMAGKFMSAMAADGLINEEPVSVCELDRVYGPLRSQVTDSVQRQETLMARVQDANTEFCQAKASSQTAAQRETMLKDLAGGYDMYMELKGNLDEGTKFYNDLTPLLLRLQTKISDFCFARKTEKDELMADLQKSIANQPTQQPPVTPTYQQPPAPQNKVAPPRPPPPAFAGAPASSAAVPPATSAAFQSYSPAGAASAPLSASAPPAQINPPPTNPPMQAGAPGQPPQQSYGYGAQWGSPYPQYPAGGGYPVPNMPAGYNPYNPYMGYPPAQQGYPGQQPTPYPSQQPATYPGQQQYPPQQYPPAGQYPQGTQWR